MQRGLATTGTLGVLLVAAERALIDADGIYHQLIAVTNFRSTPKLQESFLQRVRETAKKRT